MAALQPAGNLQALCYIGPPLLSFACCGATAEDPAAKTERCMWPVVSDVKDLDVAVVI